MKKKTIKQENVDMDNIARALSRNLIWAVIIKAISGIQRLNQKQKRN